MKDSANYRYLCRLFGFLTAPVSKMSKTKQHLFKGRVLPGRFVWPWVMILGGSIHAANPQVTIADDLRRDATVRAVEEAMPCVVNIRTEIMVERRDFYYDLLWDFFGPYYRQRPSESTYSLGSGVIVHESGYVLTNAHVINRANRIQVVLHDGSAYEAEMVAGITASDVAVLKITPTAPVTRFQAIQFAEDDDLLLGESVLALGNPFGLGSSVSQGILSSKNRRPPTEHQPLDVDHWLQTDAAINPGNSGGALVDINGNLIGINTSIISRTGSYAGYGFAVPSDIVVKIVEDLKKYKVVQKAFTGAEVLDIDENLAKKAGIKNLNGVLVESIRRQGAADNAGLEPGDVIKRIDGKNISSKSSYDEVIGSRSPGDKITVQYERNGRLFETELVLENVYGNTEILGEEALDKDDIYFSNYLGAELRKLTPGEKQRMGLKIGVVVSKIDKERGFMRRLDLEEGDVILAINRRGAQDPEAVAKYIQNYYGRIYFEIIDKSGTQRTLTYRFQ